MTRPPLPLLVLVLAVWAVPAAPAAPARSCASGETIFDKGGVRFFEDGRRGDDEWYACGPRTRRPVAVVRQAAGFGGLSVRGRRGHRVLFESTESTEGGSGFTTVGYFDVRTSRVHAGGLAGESGPELVDVVPARNGGLGVVARSEEGAPARVGYLAPARRGLKTEVVLSAVGGRYAPRSLAFTDGGRTLIWRVAGGDSRSVPLRGEAPSCATGTTLAEAGGTRVFEVISVRRPQRALLLACPAGVQQPRQLASAPIRRLWSLRSIKSVGARLVFLVGEAGVGFTEGGPLHFGQVGDVQVVHDVAVGPSGPPVLAARSELGQNVVGVFRDDAGMPLASWEALATLGGDLVGKTLSVGDDGRVHWRTKDYAQSAPIGGEHSITCTSGTTTTARDGVRVFQVLPPGADEARLFGCQPGSGEPVALLTGRRALTWFTREEARENGRVVLSAFPTRHLLSFAATADSARVGIRDEHLDRSYDIREAAAAADGRVGLVLRLRGRSRIRITYFALGAPGELAREREVARPTDGVQASSLAFSADGTRLEWRNRAGESRGVAL